MRRQISFQDAFLSENARKQSHSKRDPCVKVLHRADVLQRGSKTGQPLLYSEAVASEGISLVFDLTFLLPLLCPPAVCDLGAHAGADVQTQDLQPQSQRLPQDLPLPEMAEDGGTAR